MQVEITKDLIDMPPAVQGYWRLQDTLITSYTTEVSDQGSAAIEQYEIMPRGILTYGYNSIDSKGAIMGNAEFSWDLTSGKVSSSVTGTVNDFQFIMGDSDITDLEYVPFPPHSPPPITRDYNQDGKVDAADYVVWRKNQGTTTALPNDLIGGTIGQTQYDQWRENFGRAAASGSNAAAGAPARAPAAFSAVPEPAAVCSRRLPPHVL